MKYFSALYVFAIVAVGTVMALEAGDANNLGNNIKDAYATQDVATVWGKGKYQFDDDYYHRTVKPKIMQQFQAKFHNFNSVCGTNPNFDMDRDGTVYPNAMKGKACTKAKFNLDLSDLLKSLLPAEEESNE